SSLGHTHHQGSAALFPVLPLPGVDSGAIPLNVRLGPVGSPVSRAVGCYAARHHRALDAGTGARERTGRTPLDGFALDPEAFACTGSRRNRAVAESRPRAHVPDRPHSAVTS